MKNIEPNVLLIEPTETCEQSNLLVRSSSDKAVLSQRRNEWKSWSNNNYPKHHKIWMAKL